MRHVSPMLCHGVTRCEDRWVSREAEPECPVLTDQAGILAPQQRKQLAALLETHNQKGPGRISVLIIKRLPEGTSLERHAADKINEPPLAPSQKADRVLLLIAMEDRKLRIETSKEVWTALPDLLQKRYRLHHHAEV